MRLTSKQKEARAIRRPRKAATRVEERRAGEGCLCTNLRFPLDRSVHCVSAVFSLTDSQQSFPWLLLLVLPLSLSLEACCQTAGKQRNLWIFAQVSLRSPPWTPKASLCRCCSCCSLLHHHTRRFQKVSLSVSLSLFLALFVLSFALFTSSFEREQYQRSLVVWFVSLALAVSSPWISSQKQKHIVPGSGSTRKFRGARPETMKGIACTTLFCGVHLFFRWFFFPTR